jgi:hypothetical protein
MRDGTLNTITSQTGNTMTRTLITSIEVHMRGGIPDTTTVPQLQDTTKRMVTTLGTSSIVPVPGLQECTMILIIRLAVNQKVSLTTTMENWLQLSTKSGSDKIQS